MRICMTKTNKSKWAMLGPSIVATVLIFPALPASAQAYTNLQPSRPNAIIAPCSEYADAHWGLPTDGLQLAVLLTQTNFAQEEPIEVTIICRNVTPTTRRMCQFITYPFQFSLGQGSNTFNWAPAKFDPSKFDPDRGFRSIPYELYTKCQQSWVVRVDPLFNLKQPGEYSIQVTFPQFRAEGDIRQLYAEGRVTTNIVSGVANFEIVEKHSQ